MASWSFLTNHARTLLCIARDPGIRFRDIAVEVGITERRAQWHRGRSRRSRIPGQTEDRAAQPLPDRRPFPTPRLRHPRTDDRPDARRARRGRTSAAENPRQARFTMADRPRSNTAAHSRVSGHPQRARHVLRAASRCGVIGTSHHRALWDRTCPGGGNWFVGDDALPRGLAAGWWSCPCWAVRAG
jgi:hypothetical protein